jgi:hypothetical protein
MDRGVLNGSATKRRTRQAGGGTALNTDWFLSVSISALLLTANQLQCHM